MVLTCPFMRTIYIGMITYTQPVADPGFPAGGRKPRQGAWTPEAVTFQKNCVSK